MNVFKCLNSRLLTFKSVLNWFQWKCGAFLYYLMKKCQLQTAFSQVYLPLQIQIYSERLCFNFFCLSVSFCTCTHFVYLNANYIKWIVRILHSYDSCNSVQSYTSNSSVLLSGMTQMRTNWKIPCEVCLERKQPYLCSILISLIWLLQAYSDILRQLKYSVTEDSHNGG